MKREPSPLGNSLRSVALVITLVSFVTFSTIGYSAYADLTNVLNTVHSGASSPAISSRTVIQGSAANVYLNVTLENGGLYPVALSLSCSPSAGSGTSCNSPTINVMPGQSQTLHFVMTLQNYSQSLADGLQIDGQVQVSLEPFASVNVSVNLGSLISGGAQ